MRRPGLSSTLPCESRAEGDQQTACHALEPCLDARAREHCAEAIDEPSVRGEPNESHRDVYAREQQTSAKQRLTRRDELRQKRQIENSDLRVEDVR